MSRSTRVERRWLPGGWPLLGERRGGSFQRDGIDDPGLVPVGPPGRHPIDVVRPLVDPADTRGHRPPAQAHPSNLDATFSPMIAARPTEGPDFPDSILNPVAKRCSMNDRSGCPAAVSCRSLSGSACDGRGTIGIA